MAAIDDGGAVTHSGGGSLPVISKAIELWLDGLGLSRGAMNAWTIRRALRVVAAMILALSAILIFLDWASALHL